MPPLLLPDGTLAPGAECPLGDEAVIEALVLMIRSRLVDERGVSFQRQGRIGTFSEARGQEAATAGSALALDPATDWVVQAYRELPALLRQGMSLTQYWMLFIGHPDGWAFPADVNVFPLQIELGTQLPHAVGMAWGLRLQRRPGVVIGYFGDGASSEGDFYEAGNLAGVTEAPVVLFCQNNGWAISTPRQKQTRAETIAAKAAAFGIPGYVVDGNDVMAVYAVTKEAVERARAGGGPTLIEAQTYRLGAHNTADDPTRYSAKEEREDWERRDPLARLRTYAINAGLWDKERDEELAERTYAEIDDAFREAQERSAARTPAMLFDHVYANPPARLERQRRLIEEEEGLWLS
ncbi:MAG TPA: thiamine pyrophosphate-dependent enzyme [Acidimicrobiia bacterium]|nr:thiamine pyrophosphate-dependent enzyme [Acidimicrobiia bacterium]